jgi:hypothetical protein
VAHLTLEKTALPKTPRILGRDLPPSVSPSSQEPVAFGWQIDSIQKVY